MNRIWNLLCLPALLALTVMVLPVRTADSDKPTLENKIDQLTKQLADRDKALADQDNQLAKAFRQLDKRLSDIEDELKSMKKRLTDLEDSSVKANGRRSNYPSDSSLTPERLRELDASIDRLRTRLDQMERSRSSFTLAPEVVGPTVAPPPAIAAMGTVRVTNAEVFPCTVTINGTPYRVAPGQTVSVPVPAGVFTYDIVSDGFGFLRRNTLPVLANSTRDMTIQ